MGIKLQKVKKTWFNRVNDTKHRQAKQKTVNIQGF